jgi:hypothetical protein
MPGGTSRDARRTERYIDGLMEAEEHGAAEVPMDLDLDPAVLVAARELRASLTRVHPSFRFEEGLAARLAQVGAATQGPRREPAAQVFPSPIAPFKAPGLAVAAAAAAVGGSMASAGRTAARDGLAPLDVPHRLSLTSRSNRPFVVGGVGVASAAISLGAAYVAWRWSRGSQTPMVRAVRAARSGRGGHASGHGRRAAVLHGILGVMS